MIVAVCHFGGFCNVNRPVILYLENGECAS